MSRMTAKQRLKTMSCRECGKPMEVGSNTRKAPRCFECGVKAAIDNVAQLRSKSGPYYERYRNAMAKASEREGWG